MYENNVNWSLYNRKLVNRGRVVTIFLKQKDTDWSSELKRMNEGKRGSPYTYPDTLMWMGFGIKCIFHLGFRQLQGFIEDIADKIGFPIPDFRTIWWRIDKMEKQGVKFNMPKNGNKIDVAVDSTGLKLVNDGEYRTKKYKKSKSWAKFHAGINEETGEAVNIVVTKDNVADCKEFKSVLKPVLGITNKVDADKAYDTKNNFIVCDRFGIIPGIPVKLNASPKGVGPRSRAAKDQLGIKPRRGRPSKKRHFVTPEQKDANQKKWKKRVRHGYRWVSEGFYARFKGLFGEYVFSKKRRNIEKEIVMKTNILNLFITI